MGKRKSICKRGHNIVEVGRDSSLHCKGCEQERNTKRKPAMDMTRKRSELRIRGIKNSDGSPFTVVDYDRTYQIQQGRCAICNKHQAELDTRLASDHNHQTLKFRGLLCFNCNTSLGKLGDTEESILRVLAYLRGTL